MKSTDKKKTQSFKGAGYLVGSAIGIAAAVVVYVITGNIGITIPVATAMGLPMGIVFENKFQGKDSELNPKAQKTVIVLLGAGVIVLAVLYFVAKMVSA